MRNYSYAGETKGKSDPEDIHAVSVDGGKCSVERCECEHDHYVLMWSGNEYSKHRTWISAETDSYISLEDAR